MSVEIKRVHMVELKRRTMLATNHCHCHLVYEDVTRVSQMLRGESYVRRTRPTGCFTVTWCM